MPSDAATFFAAFTAVFAGIAAFLWHLEVKATRLEERLATLDADAEKRMKETDSGREL